MQDKGRAAYTNYLKHQIGASAEEAYTALVEASGTDKKVTNKNLKKKKSAGTSTL